MTDKEKIELIIQDKHLNNTQFCNEVCISLATLSHILSGRTQPTLNILRSISMAFPDINPAWLFYDAGSMYIDVSSPTPSTTPLEDESKRQVVQESNGSGEQMLPFDFSPEASLVGHDSKTRVSVPTAPSSSTIGARKSEAVGSTIPSVGVAEVVAETLKQQKPRRRILEVRIFFDDGTFETFGPQS